MINPNVLPLEKVRNPRDIGGYVGYQGRKVKMHRLIRSGKISNITSKDEKFLLDYGLTKIIDLRSPLECHKMPDSQIPGVELQSIWIFLLPKMTTPTVGRKIWTRFLRLTVKTNMLALE